MSKVVQEKFSIRLGEVMGMSGVFPLLALVSMLILIGIWKGLKKITENKSQTETNSISKDEEANNLCVKQDYYFNSKTTDNLIEYKISDADKEIIWICKCRVNHEIVYSIEIQTSENDRVLQVIKDDIDEAVFWVLDGEHANGKITSDDEGLHYNDLNNQVRYSAIFYKDEGNEEANVGDALKVIFFLDATPITSTNVNLVNFVVNGNKDEVLGKYFFSMRNLDLTSDIECKIDRRIAVVLSILLDIQVGA